MTNSIKFTSLQKQLILSTARTIFGDFIKKKNVLKARKEKIVADAKAALDKKLEGVEADLMVIEESQKAFEANMIQMLGGHRLEEVVNFEPVTSESGRTTMKVSFKYPDTILPPSDSTEENPHTDCAEQVEPEVDSAGFNVNDGLKEGEPAELAQVVAAAGAEQNPATEPAIVEHEAPKVPAVNPEPDADEIEDMWGQIDGSADAAQANIDPNNDPDNPFGLD